MAFCKNCNKEIEDGEVYCDACKAEESYLDDLLNFVMQENGDDQKAVHQIVKNEEPLSSDDEEALQVADEFVPEDNAELLEEHEDEINNLLGGIFGTDMFEAEADNATDEQDEFVPVFNETDDVQDFLTSLDSMSEEEIPAVNTENFGDMSELLSDLESEAESEIYADFDSEPETEPEIYTDFVSEPETEPEVYADFVSEPETEPEIYTDFISEPETEPEIYADFVSEPETEPEVYADFVSEPETEPEIYADFDMQPEAEVDTTFASQGESDGSELFDIDALLNNQELFDMDASSEETVAANDTGADFGEDDDILKYLQTLNETEGVSDYDEIPVQQQETVADNPPVNNKEVKVKERKVAKDTKKKVTKTSVADFFKKVFGNVKVERTPEEVEKLKKDALAKYEANEAKKQADKVKAAKNKEERQKKKEIDDAAKQEQKLAKEKEALEKKRKKEEEKKLAKDKKALEKKRILEEIDEYEGSINRIGASIVFLLFGTLLIFIVAGTNIYTYNIAIKNAQKDFENKEYNDAYEQVAGIDILEEDIVVYERIMTVMYVNKQLNSYYNYMVLDKPELALDSLLKGLMRYDKYIAYARQLEITEHLDYVKSMLLQELELEFALTEDVAYDIIKSESQEEYSNKIIEMTANME